LQHAENPVDWSTWGDEAFSRALAEDKPVLLSIGYSACHWCHVMESESFEDAETAFIMNARFVSVKVDREERPDLDEIYMHAVQAFTGGHGGWPMTVFLTPEKLPFYAGTYFPPVATRGLPAFRDVLEHVARIWRERRADIGRVTTDLSEHLKGVGRLPAPAAEVGVDWLERVAASCGSDFDARFGGFGGAPKFPSSRALGVLLAHWKRTSDDTSRAMAATTLDRMAAGGMYDVLGGGFARYSVDAEWLIPHFEKMLCDNAELACMYIDAYVAFARETYGRVAQETLDYVLRDMTSAEGAFLSSEDADSEGHEGKFYVWTPQDVVAVLGEPDGKRACAMLGIVEGGNFKSGTSVVRPAAAIESMSPDDRSFFEKAKAALLAARGQRVRPGRDDKVITAWNALAISAFARAAIAFGDERFRAAATRAAEFVGQELTLAGRLQRTWKAGRAHIPAFLDDHANFLAALLDVYEATFDAGWVKRALALADEMVRLFWDETDGGFFYRGIDAEPFFARSKHPLGGAEPSGNGVAALAFARLATLCGRDDLGEKADRILRSYAPILLRAARVLGPEAIAGAWRTGDVEEIGIVGPADDPTVRAMLAEIRRRFHPFRVVCRLDPGAPTDLFPWMIARTDTGGCARAFVCRGTTCLAPVDTAEALALQLDQGY
jgi:uncharacterized protein YyaL (SSP411 family)